MRHDVAMSIKRIASAVALLAIVGAPARAAAPLLPTGKWNVDFGDAHCTAVRNYGPADKPITLAFKPAPIGDVMQLSVVRAARRAEMNQYFGTMRVDQAAPVAISMLGHPGDDGQLRITSVKLTQASYAPLRAAATLRLRSSGEIDTTFTLSHMNEVARALDRCMVGLRQMWHIGDHGAALKQGPVNRQPLSDLFTSNDYPRVALYNDGTGTVQAMMLIDETGRIASCMVTETSGHASLDAQTCIILARRARFNPAIGADGKPAKSGTTARIRWRK